MKKTAQERSLTAAAVFKQLLGRDISHGLRLPESSRGMSITERRDLARLQTRERVAMKFAPVLALNR